MKTNNEKLLNTVKKHVSVVVGKIQGKLNSVEQIAHQSLKGFGKLLPEDQAVFMSLRGHAYKRISELTHLKNSPYFMKCEIIDEQGQLKDYYFAKHEFSEEQIYSWVAPVSVIRFENPGKVSYEIPNGETRNITIKQKETYMIVDGKVLLFTLENKDRPRELIYQEHFTKQKSEFILPEIVAQMEKAQDQVIRASHKGPLAISGPAGSGKTTLALHRVAYLTQVPDTAILYPPESIIVMVQDNGTKNYFSTLLPSLGINDVKITTFSQWAFKILNLEEYSYAERYGDTEENKDLYEYQKLKSLKELSDSISSNKNVYTVLGSQYSKYFSADNLKLFDQQKKDKKLDRFDLTILLKILYNKNKKFETKREYFTPVKGKVVRKTEKSLVLYSLMIIDEFQNYLPEQLEMLKTCLNENTKSIVYVGDMAQQVKLGTIRDWNNIKEIISEDRNITLNKVYRNTENILSFIKNLGYAIELPTGLKQGPDVVEKVTESTEEEIEHIKKLIPKYKNGSIGILSKEESSLEKFRKEFKNIQNIHILSMLEAQGVEFDLVCIVGINKESFKIAQNIDISPLHIIERKRMQKDLLYVGLTRAISELHILGKEKLKDVLFI